MTRPDTLLAAITGAPGNRWTILSRLAYVGITLWTAAFGYWAATITLLAVLFVLGLVDAVVAEITRTRTDPEQ